MLKSGKKARGLQMRKGGSQNEIYRRFSRCTVKDIFSGTLSEYERHLEEHYFNQEDDCSVEEVDELDFSA